MLRSSSSRFLRFCIVGTIGFAVDAGSLMFLIRFAGMGPIVGRAISFPLAVAVTWLLNRTWTFEAAEEASAKEFLSYVGVQSFGVACNFFVYTTLLIVAPVPFSLPQVALAIASLVALAANYFGVRKIVFVRRMGMQNRH